SRRYNRLARGSVASEPPLARVLKERLMETRVDTRRLRRGHWRRRGDRVAVPRRRSAPGGPPHPLPRGRAAWRGKDPSISRDFAVTPDRKPSVVIEGAGEPKLGGDRCDRTPR